MGVFSNKIILVMVLEDQRTKGTQGKKYKNNDDEQARRNGNLDDGRRQAKRVTICEGA